METWGVKLTAEGKSLTEVKIQRCIFKGDALSPLLFVIAMMPLNHIRRKCTAWYKLSWSQEKINYLMYKDDIKLFAKNERELEILIETMRIYSQDIEMEFDIEKCAMLIMKIGKRHMTPRKNQNARGKGNLQILGNIGSWHHQTSGDERKESKKSISGERESYSRQNYIARTLSKG